MPRIVSCGSVLIGMPTMASANSGRAPIAYRSDSAFVAAMRRSRNGSSTMGMKKSVVATIAWRSSRRYTAASSQVRGQPAVRPVPEVLERRAASFSTPRDLAAAAAAMRERSVVAGHRPLKGRGLRVRGHADISCGNANGGRQQSRTYQGAIDTPYWV